MYDRNDWHGRGQDVPGRAGHGQEQVDWHGHVQDIRERDGHGQEHAGWNRRRGDWDRDRDWGRDWDRDDWHGRGGYNPWARQTYWNCDPGIYIVPPVQPEIVFVPPIYPGGAYQNDSVYGGPWGYQANRQRYNGGWYNPGYDTGCFGNYNCYDYGNNYRNNYSYDYGYSYPQNYGSTVYQGDTVSGGPGGYQANRQRYNSGWSNPGYNSGYDNGWNQAGQGFNMLLQGFDAWAGYDIARRYTRR